MVIGNKTKKSRQHRLDRKKSISNEGNHPKRTTVSPGAIPLPLCSFCRHRPQLSLLVTQITSLISLFNIYIISLFYACVNNFVRVAKTFFCPQKRMVCGFCRHAGLVKSVLNFYLLLKNYEIYCIIEWVYINRRISAQNNS